MYGVKWMGRTAMDDTAVVDVLDRLEDSAHKVGGIAADQWASKYLLSYKRGQERAYSS